MRYYLLLCSFILHVAAFAQDDLTHISLHNSKSGLHQEKYFSIGINPFSLVESQMSIGPCASYRFLPRLELWSEVSFIFHNLYMDRKWEQMRGFRFILQPRYYIKRFNNFFITPEFRLKNFSFDNRLNVVNDATADTLRNYPFREIQTLVGGALVIGQQYKLSSRRNLFLEVTVGIGGKQRFIKRKLPKGYYYDEFRYDRYALAPSYEDSDAGTVYFPFGFRFIKKLQ